MKYALWLLTLVSLFNYVDRFLIGALAPQIIQTFHLSHLQGGFLISAFMVGYMIFSPIFGPLGDRKHRPRLMAVGILAWTIFTALCGVVSSFALLLLLRMMVGVGEASFASLAPTYLRDLASNDRSANRAFSIFYLAIPLGAALGFLLGGFVAENLAWNLGFFIAAAPGAILALLTYRLKDSARAGTPESARPLFQSIRELWKIRPYRGVVLGYVAFTFAIGGFAAWVPEYGINTLGVTSTQINSGFGLVTVLGAVIGTLIGGRLGTLFLSSGLAIEGFCLFAAFCSLFSLPFAILAFSTHSLNSFLGYMLIAEIFLFASTAPINTAIVDAVPKNLSTTAMAFSTFLIHAFGDFLSPPAVGLLSDLIPMQRAIFLLPAAIFVSAVVWGQVGRKQNGLEAEDPFFLTPLKEGVGRTLQWIFRQSMNIFFQEVRIYENGIYSSKRSPSEGTSGATLYIANHPNGLIDPLVVYSTAGETLRFIAKSTLWKIPIIRNVLNLTGAVPVFRAEDEAENTKKGLSKKPSAPQSNQQSLEIAARALKRHSFLIFPEGRSHGLPNLSQFKTGPSRLILQSAKMHDGNLDHFAFQPVGLYFDQKSIFRSRVLLHYGKRKSLSEMVSAEARAKFESDSLDSTVYQELTKKMQSELESLLPLADSPEEYYSVRGTSTLLLEANKKSQIHDLYQKEVAIRQILDKLKSLGKVEKTENLRKQIGNYFESMSQAQVSDRIVRDVVTDEGAFGPRAIRRQIKFWGLSLLTFPFILLGFLFYYLPYRLTGKIAERYAQDPEEIATFKFIVGVITMLGATLVYGAAIAIFGVHQGKLLYGLLAGTLLPGTSAVSALIFGERMGERGEELRYLFSSRFRHWINQKGIERQALVVRLWEFYQENFNKG